MGCQKSLLGFLTHFPVKEIRVSRKMSTDSVLSSLANYQPVSMWLLTPDTTVADHVSFLLQILVKMVRENWSFCDVNDHVYQFWFQPFDPEGRIKYTDLNSVIELQPLSHRVFYRKKQGKNGRCFDQLMLEVGQLDPDMGETYRRLHRQFYDTPPRVEHIQFLRFLANHQELSTLEVGRAMKTILLSVEENEGRVRK